MAMIWITVELKFEVRWRHQIISNQIPFGNVVAFVKLSAVIGTQIVHPFCINDTNFSFNLICKSICVKREIRNNI